MTYQQFVVNSEKGAPLAEYVAHDGTVRINLDEHWDQTKMFYFCRRENALIELVIDSMIHEDTHKALSEAEGPDEETINETQERIMMMISDWVDLGKKKSIVEYDWNP